MRGPTHDNHDKAIETEAYELFKRVYGQVLGENKMEDLCRNGVGLYVGMNMLNDLYLGGIDGHGFIHKFSSIDDISGDDISARSGLLLLCNKGFCARDSNIGVDTLQEFFRKSEHLTGYELLHHICEGMDAYLNLYSDRMMIHKTDFKSLFESLNKNRTRFLSQTTTQYSSYLKAVRTPLDQVVRIEWEDHVEASIPWVLYEPHN